MLVEAVYGPPSATAAEVETTNIDAYKELLQKIKVHTGIPLFCVEQLMT